MTLRLPIFALATVCAGAVAAEPLTISVASSGQEGENLAAVLSVFTEKTGIEVSLTNFDQQQVLVDLEAGSPADITVFPQPGFAADMAARGFLTPLGDDVAVWLGENYSAGQSWVDLGTYAGQDGSEALYGFPFKIDMKSLVWYLPLNFEDAGYEVPTTLEELKALTDQIVADGGTPWCIGLGSGSATGWPATDWVEDLMLRVHPPEVYDAWVSNSIPFNDPRVVEAIEEFGWFARNDAYVPGGASAVAATDFRDSPKGLFTVPPQCFMHRQASFVPAFFPEGVQPGEDYDFFYFPSYESKDLGNPVLGAGSIWTITNDSPDAHQLIAFLQTTEAHEAWMALDGFLTPYREVDLDAFTNPATRKMNEILLDATTFRFDGSDLMPGAIGAGTFWTGMIDYVGGRTAQEVADSIQASWEALQ